jgi:hypothetical protein
MALSQDVLHAFRSFRSKPILPLAVVSILAVGIGATTAVFSVVDRVLFRPLPYGAAERLVSLGIRIPWLEYDFLTAGSYGDLRRDPGPFAEPVWRIAIGRATGRRASGVLAWSPRSCRCSAWLRRWGGTSRRRRTGRVPRGSR